MRTSGIQTMASVIFRAASDQDVPAIAALHAESWRSTYRGVFRDAFLDGDVHEERRATWAKRLASPVDGQIVLLCTEQDLLRGFLCAYAQADAGWGAFIDNLHVVPESKGSGIGTRLLHMAANWADTKRPELPPYLWVVQENVAAQRFYSRRGADQRETVILENPCGGSAKYVRYAWEDPAHMITQCATPGARRSGG